MKKFISIAVMVLAFGTVLPLCQAIENKAADKIHVDQVGYLSQYPKTAVVVDKGATSFKIVNADTHAVVYQGLLSKPCKDLASGDVVRRADFSMVTQPGLYKVEVDGIGSSYTFNIGDNVYYIPLIHTLRSYTLGRCNAQFADALTGLTLNGAHEKDKAAKVFFSDAVSVKGQTVDVSGGWYDAGDYGKYVSTGGITVANILLAYEAQPEKFTTGQLFFPDGIAGDKVMPDILVELKYELDWLLKMQRFDGSVFHKVSGRFWPGMISPMEDTQSRYLYGISTSSTAICGASLAMAARSYEKYDPEYAAELLAAAQKAFNYMEQQETPVYRLDEGQDNGSGAYDKKTDMEERIWLAAELYKTTGDTHYDNYLKSKFANKLLGKPESFGWFNTLALGQWAYITNQNADATIKNKIKQTFLSYADEVVTRISRDGYSCSLDEKDYTWASTKNAMINANMLLLASLIEPKPEYVHSALEQVHYMFGRNANGISYMTGAGTNYVQHPHSRIHESTKAYIPGLVVGGPNNHPGGDPLQIKLIASGKVPPAKAYLDKTESYSTNEYAIDYIAPAVYALAFFSRPDANVTANDIKLNK